MAETTAFQQIAITAPVTLNGGGDPHAWPRWRTPSPSLTFVDNGGTANPTSPPAALLTLTATTAIVANSYNAATRPDDQRHGHLQQRDAGA